jgi:hypothetical protein
MQLVLDLQNDGVVGDNELDGNEEALINDSQTIRIDQLRHGTKSKGEMAEQATVIRFREQSKDKLGFWMADKLDELMFLTLSGRAYTLKLDGSTRTGQQLPSLRFAADVAAPSSNRIIYAGSATSEATLTTSDKMSWAVIVRAKHDGRAQALRRSSDGGKGYYCLLISSEQRARPGARPDLPDHRAVGREAAQEQRCSPARWRRRRACDLYSHNKVFNTLGWRGLEVGLRLDGRRRAGACCSARRPAASPRSAMFWRESDKTDYGNRPGVGVGRKIGMLKPQFKSLYDSEHQAGLRHDRGEDRGRGVSATTQHAGAGAPGPARRASPT